MMGETCYATGGLGAVNGWSARYDMRAKTNRPTRERRTVLSIPSASIGKEAVDSC